jgi:hypothetical protein
MEHHPQLMSPADYDLVINCLNKCLAIFQKNKGPITAEELQLRETLSTLLSEIRRQKKSHTTVPFGA